MDSVRPPNGDGALRFSLHAMGRLKSDNISLSKEDLGRLGQGLEKATDKGAREALLLLDDKAFIVNVKERLVITSIHRQRLKENVFTNIDSAVIL